MEETGSNINRAPHAACAPRWSLWYGSACYAVSSICFRQYKSQSGANTWCHVAARSRGAGMGHALYVAPVLGQPYALAPAWLNMDHPQSPSAQVWSGLQATYNMHPRLFPSAVSSISDAVYSLLGRPALYVVCRVSLEIHGPCLRSLI